MPTKLLEKQRHICHIAEQTLMAIQIAAILLIFLVSLYWFLELIGNNMLSFLDVFMKGIKSLMQAHFADSLQKGQAGLDGSLFIFIAILGTALYIISQLKIFMKYHKVLLDKKIVEQREVEEKKFNVGLQAEAKKQIMRYNNVIVLVKLTLKSLLREVYATHNDVKHIDEQQEGVVLTALYNMIKTLPNCKFTKDGKILIISSNNFDMADQILISIDKALSQIKIKLKERKLTVTTNMAIDVFPDKMHLKDVYADLKTLLQLNMPDEILCYGNFCNRYEHYKNAGFEPYLKGTYDITDDENVWSLFKKN